MLFKSALSIDFLNMSFNIHVVAKDTDNVNVVGCDSINYKVFFPVINTIIF